MANDGQTSPSLLIRVRDARDDDAWRQFVEIYEPLIFRFARQRRLQDADAADLTQHVLHEVSRALRRFDYDPGRGSFRGWLFTVVRSHLTKWRTRERRVVAGSGDSAVQAVLDRQPGREDDEAAWNLEHQRRLFLWAAQRVRGGFEESSWLAFWGTAVEGRPARRWARPWG